MNLLPSSQQRALLVGHKLHRSLQLAATHSYRPNQHRFAVSAAEIDLRLAVTEHMHMRWPMIIKVNGDPKAACAKHGYHRRV